MNYSQRGFETLCFRVIQILDPKYLSGWGHYYLTVNAYQLTVNLDHWLHLRIRMCYWRQ
ncbi:group II intron maturase-specific domain-containing protein [Pseudoalteromonas sp. ASV78]|uniref:group II intron maturase-specific domain-containing protein n=1 Tax=Pseudoalteromonas sp. ASV78 TaxID=3397851 RepID=UPI0039FCA771